jgi:hypothetical protein
MDERERLAAEIADPGIISYFYLDIPSTAVLERLDGLRLKLSSRQDNVPFNAQVKGYFGAEDEEGHPWILKPASDPKEILYHRISTLVFILDHWMGTLSAPTSVFSIDGKTWRASKVVRNAVQISSYDYLGHPYIDMIRADLVNRWLTFDEDRNPNNYLVIHNKANKPFLTAIDFDKSDLTADCMKITGLPDKFGWHRTEKTRFLTLLRPDNFDGVPIETFDARLKAMMAIPAEELREVCRRLLAGFEADQGLADRLVANILCRRDYIDAYFRTWFKPEAETKNLSHEDDYSMFGESFLAMHKNRK